MSGLNSGNVPPPPPPRSAGGSGSGAAAAATASTARPLTASSVPPPPPRHARAGGAASASAAATATAAAAAQRAADDDASVSEGELLPAKTSAAELRELSAAAGGRVGRSAADFAADPLVRSALAGDGGGGGGVAATAADGIDRSKHKSGIVPTLQNIVSTCYLGCALDLKTIALHARNAEYNPKRFQAVIMRIREPKTTALVFASGKMVCTGAKSEEAAKQASRKYARTIMKLGFEVRFLDFKLQNIVASADVRFPVRLESLATQHSKYSSYEPELFPGLIYRLIKPKITLLIFVSGKIVLTGGKKRDDIYQAFELIYSVLKLFRKQTLQPSIAPTVTASATAASAAAASATAATSATAGAASSNNAHGATQDK